MTWEAAADGILTTFIMQYDQKIKIGNKRNVEATERAKAKIDALLIAERIEEIDKMICNRHYGEGYADFFTEYANNRKAELESQLEANGASE